MDAYLKHKPLKLKSIKYKQFRSVYLVALQVFFEGEIQSPMFEEPYYKKFASDFKTVEVDKSRPVRKLVMKADSKGLYGLKMLDAANKSVWETKWSSKGDLVTKELEQGS